MKSCDEHDEFVVVYNEIRQHGYSCPVCGLQRDIRDLELELSYANRQLRDLAEKDGK